MENYPNEVVLDLFIIHGMCQKVIARTIRKFNLKYPNLPMMTRGKFSRLINNFSNFGKVARPITRVKAVTDNEDHQIIILGYFQAYPQASIRTASLELGFSYSAIQRILHRHKLHPFSFIRMQKLHPGDFLRRTNFCEDLLIKIQEHDRFLENIIWTDEAKFCQQGVYNGRNRHFWAYENPHMVLEIENQVQFSINVFCLVMNQEVHYFMYDDNLNGAKYLEILQNTVETFLENLPLARAVHAWYQMDGAPAHNARTIHTKLMSLFDDRWWGNKGPFLWPARSPDLTPLDFYVWGRIKNLVYSSPLRNKDDLRDRIIEAFNSLDPNEIRRATQSVENRIIECLNQNGHHIEHLL